MKMENVRLVLAEALRLYPQPPLLIRRSIGPDNIPNPVSSLPEKAYPIGKGADLFISTWNIHRSPFLWDEPNEFNPNRFKSIKDINSLLPNEISTNFAFLPFGAGGRKCVGDQFASLEAIVCFSLILKHFRYLIIIAN